MPSGSKKRKAAKKKKVQVTNNVKSSINNNPYGNDDPKSQGKTDSDGNDVGSRASMDDHNNHQHPFNHSENERERAPSHIEESHVTEEKFVEEAARDVKFTEKHGSDDVETTCVRVQHVEHDKSSTCSSSSDDESRALKKKSKEEACNVGSEVTSYGNEDNSATVMSKGVPKVAENGPRNSGTVIYSQPLVASTHPMLQRTSLLSCCGLFDVLTGSGR